MIFWLSSLTDARFTRCTAALVLKALFLSPVFYTQTVEEREVNLLSDDLTNIAFLHKAVVIHSFTDDGHL